MKGSLDSCAGMAIRVKAAAPIGTTVYHIRAIVDGDYIVHRHYSKRRQRWIYEVCHRDRFDLYHEQNMLEIIKRG